MKKYDSLKVSPKWNKDQTEAHNSIVRNAKRLGQMPIYSRTPSKKFRENWDKIFNKK